MSTLRDLLEAKERRRLVVPIQVSDATEDHETWMGIYAAVQAAKVRDDAASVAMLEQELEQAHARVQDHWASVELQALSSAEWETASRVWGTDDGDQIDWPKALAPLMAASCVDPQLRDIAWWETQLARETWSEGDRDALKMSLLRLNVSALEPHLPKG